MVFKDFDRARAEAIIAVNDFLKKTWGIEDYTRLAPAALLFRVPGYKGFHAFPLLLEDVDDRGWTASVFGESTEEIQVSGENGRGELKLRINEEIVSRLEDEDTKLDSVDSEENKVVYVSKGDISPDDDKEEGFKDFLRQSFPSGKGASLQVFGTFIEPYSGRRLNFYAADARRPAERFTPDHQFRLANWLRERFEEGSVYRAVIKGEVAPASEGVGESPVAS